MKDLGNYAISQTMKVYVAMNWSVIALFVLSSVLCFLPWHTTTSDSMTNSVQHFPQHMLPMDPQVCPLPLNSSQSVISGLDKSPASTFRPSHSRSNSTGSAKHTKQVAGHTGFFTMENI